MVTQQHRVGLFATLKAMAARTKRGIFVLLFCVIATNAYAGSAPVNITLTITPNPIVSGKPTKFTVSVTAQSGSGTPTGTVDIFAAGQQCTITLPGTNCSLTVSGSGSITVTAVYNGDANFAGNGISKTTPVVSQTNVFLDQFGLTGTWYNAATSGQGFVLVSYPDLAGAGTGVIAGGWFTFDVTSGGADKQRWYTFSGNARSIDALATLDLFATTGGNFNAGPKVAATKIGQVALQFSDCDTGSVTYSFNDGRSGRIPITRLTANVTCGATRDNGTPGGSYLLSGAWYDPNTSGQGLLVEVNPVGNYLAAAWYTFSPNGQATGGGASQRWYTLQAAPLSPGSKTITNVDIYTRTGGVFDNAAPSTQSKVGSATLTFQDCNTATLTFSFSSGSSAGQSGSINLQRVGPAPTGCNL